MAKPSYIKNLAQSIKYSAVDSLKEMNPVITSFYDTNAETIDNAYKAIASIRESVKSPESKGLLGTAKGVGVDYLKNLVNDARSGKFYNKERIDKAAEASAAAFLGEDFDFGDFSLDDGFVASDDDDDVSFSFDDGDEIASKTVSAIGEISARSAQYQVEAHRSMNKAMYEQQTVMFGHLHSDLGALNTNVGSIMKFMQEAATPHFQNSKTFYETATESLNTTNKILTEMLELQKKQMGLLEQQTAYNRRRTFEDLFDANGNINLAEYMAAVKERVEGEAGGTGDMLKLFTKKGMLDTFIASPLQGVTDAFVKAFMPQLLKEGMTELNKSLSGFFSSALVKLNEIGEDDYGMLGSVARFLGFNSRMSKTVNASAYKKDAVPFDGVTRKAIIEVIPTYLSKIYSSLSGTKENRFDYENGRFVTVESLNDTLRETFDMYSRNSARDLMEHFYPMMDAIDFKGGEERKKSLESDMKKIFDYYFRTGRTFNKHNGARTYGLDGEFSDENLKIFLRMWEKLPNSVKLGYAKNVQKSRSGYTSEMNAIEQNGLSPLIALFNNSLADPINPAYSNERWVESIPTLNVPKQKSAPAASGSAQQSSADTKKSAGSNKDIISGEYTWDETRFAEGVNDTLKRYYKANEKDFSLDPVGAMSEKFFKREAKDVLPRLSKPTSIIRAIMDSVDNHMYTLIFGDDKFSQDMEYNGFLRAVIHRLEDTFIKFTDWMDDTIINPIRAKVNRNTMHDAASKVFDLFGFDFDEVAKKTKDFFIGDNGIFSGYIQGVKSSAKELGGYVKNSFNDVLEATGIKGKLNESGLAAKARNSKINQAVQNMLRDTRTAPTPEALLQVGFDFKNQIDGLGKTEPATEGDIPQAAKGLRRVNKTGVIVASEGEMIIPPDLNPFNIRQRERNENRAKKAFIDSIQGYAKGGTVKFDFDKMSKKQILEALHDQENNGMAQYRRYLAEYGRSKKDALSRDHYSDLTLGQKMLDEVRNIGGKLVDVIQDGGNEAIKAVIGKSNQVSGSFEEARKDIMTNIRQYLPHATIGAGLGAAGSLVAGLVGGPLVGAAAGAAISIAKDSSALQNWLFGKPNEKGERGGGLVPKDISNLITKYIPDMAKGSMLGAITSVLPFVPGGPLAGMVVGSGLAIVKNNKMIQEALFGGEGKNGLLGKNFIPNLKRRLPKMGLGAIAGAITGPFGVAANVILGSALAWASDTGAAQDFLFGAKNPTTGKREGGGLISAIDRVLIKPNVNFVKETAIGIRDWFNKDIKRNFMDFWRPFTQDIKNAGRDFFDFLKRTSDDFFEKFLKTTVGRKLEWLFSGIGNISRAVIKGIGIETPKFLLGLPFRLLGGIGRLRTDAQIRAGKADNMSAVERLAWRQRRTNKLSNKLLRGKDKYGSLDNLLASMDSKDVEALRDNMRYARKGAKAVKDDKREVVNNIKSLTDILDTKNQSRILAMIETGDTAAISRLIDALPNRVTGRDGTEHVIDHDRLKAAVLANTNRYHRAQVAERDLARSSRQAKRELAKTLGLDPDKADKILKDRNIDRYIESEYKARGLFGKGQYKSKQEEMGLNQYNTKQDERFKAINENFSKVIDSLEFIRKQMMTNADTNFIKMNQEDEAVDFANRSLSSKTIGLARHRNRAALAKHLRTKGAYKRNAKSQLIEAYDPMYWERKMAAIDAELIKEGEELVDLDSGEVIDESGASSKKMSNRKRKRANRRARKAAERRERELAAQSNISNAARGLARLGRSGLVVASKGEYIVPARFNPFNIRGYAEGTGSVDFVGDSNSDNIVKNLMNRELAKASQDNVRYEFREGKTYRYVKQRDGSWIADISDSETKENIKANEEEKATQTGILDSLKSMPSKILGFFGGTKKDDDDDEEEGGFFSKFLGKATSIGAALFKSAGALLLLPQIKKVWDYFKIGDILAGIAPAVTNGIKTYLPKVVETVTTTAKTLIPTVVDTIKTTLPEIKTAITEAFTDSFKIVLGSFGIDKNGDGTVSAEEIGDKALDLGAAGAGKAVNFGLGKAKDAAKNWIKALNPFNYFMTDGLKESTAIKNGGVGRPMAFLRSFITGGGSKLSQKGAGALEGIGKAVSWLGSNKLAQFAEHIPILGNFAKLGNLTAKAGGWLTGRAGRGIKTFGDYGAQLLPKWLVGSESKERVLNKALGDGMKEGSLLYNLVMNENNWGAAIKDTLDSNNVGKKVLAVTEKAKSLLGKGKGFVGSKLDDVAGTKAGGWIAGKFTNFAEAVASRGSRMKDLIDAYVLENGTGIIGKVIKKLTEGVPKLFTDSKVVGFIKKAFTGELDQVATAAIKESLEKFANILVKYISKYISEELGELTGELAAKIAGAFASAGGSQIVLGIYSFIKGWGDTDQLFNIKNPGIAEKLIAGTVGCLNEIFCFGLVPVDILTDFAIKALKEVDLFSNVLSGLTDRQQALLDEVAAYNQENDENLTVDEYLEKDKFRYKFKQGVKAGWKNIKEAFNWGNRYNLTGIQAQADSFASGAVGNPEYMVYDPALMMSDPYMAMQNAIAGAGAMQKAKGNSAYDQIAATVEEAATGAKDASEEQAKKAETDLKNAAKGDSTSFWKDFTVGSNDTPWGTIVEANRKLFLAPSLMATELANEIEPTITEATKRLQDTTSLTSKSGGFITTFKALLAGGSTNSSNTNSTISGMTKASGTNSSTSGSTSGSDSSSDTSGDIKDKTTSTESKSLWQKLFGTGSGSKIDKKGRGPITGMASGSNPPTDDPYEVSPVSRLGNQYNRQMINDELFVSQVNGNLSGKTFNTPEDTVRQTVSDAACAPAVATMAVNVARRNGEGGRSLSFSDAINTAISYKAPDSGVTADYFIEQFAKNNLSTAFISSESQQKMNESIVGMLKQNKPVVLMGQDTRNTSKKNSPFGPNGHYVLATGISPDGKYVYINDPESKTPNAMYPIEVLNAVSLGIAPVSKNSKLDSVTRQSKIKEMMKVYRANGLTGGSNREKVYNFLRSKGATAEVAAAIIGNIMQESKCEPAMTQGGKLYPDPKSWSGGPGSGLCQWEKNWNGKTGDRFNGLVALAKQFGKDWTNMECQLMFLWQELQSESAWKLYLKNNYGMTPTQFLSIGGQAGGGVASGATVENIKKATEIFCTCFERCNKAQANMSYRNSEALKAYNEFSGNTVVGMTSSVSKVGNPSFHKYSDATEADIRGIATIALGEQGSSEEGQKAEASLLLNLAEMRYGNSEESKYSMANVRKMARSGWFYNGQDRFDRPTVAANSQQYRWIEDVVKNGYRTLPGYIDEHDFLGDISYAENNGTNISNLEDHSQYKQHVTRIHQASSVGSGQWTYYSHPASNSDPFGYTDSAKALRGKRGEGYYTVEGNAVGGDSSSASSGPSLPPWMSPKTYSDIFTVFDDLAAAYGLSTGNTTGESGTAEAGSYDVSGATVSDAQKAELQRKMAESFIKSENALPQYSQSSRYNYSIADDGTITGTSADCSSLTQGVYKKFLNVDPGSWTGDMLSSKNTFTVEKGTGRPGSAPTISKLQLGDLLIYGPGPNGSHVELYTGGDRTMGHGSAPGPHYAKPTGDTSTKMINYQSEQKGLNEVRRWFGFREAGTPVMQNISQAAMGSGLLKKGARKPLTGMGGNVAKHVRNLVSGRGTSNNAAERYVKRSYLRGSGTSGYDSAASISIPEYSTDYNYGYTLSKGSDAYTNVTNNTSNNVTKVTSVGADNSARLLDMLKSVVGLLVKMVDTSDTNLKQLVTLVTKLVAIASTNDGDSNNPNSDRQKRAAEAANVKADLMNALNTSSKESANGELIKLINEINAIAAM